MHSQRLWTAPTSNTSSPLSEGRARRKLKEGLQPCRRASVTSLGCLTRWITLLRAARDDRRYGSNPRARLPESAPLIAVAAEAFECLSASGQTEAGIGYGG